MSEPLHDLLDAVERALTQCVARPPHPAILRIFAVRREGRHLVVECEKPGGIPLSNVLRQEQRLSFDDALKCLRPLAAATEHAAENQMPRLDFAVTSIIVESGDMDRTGGAPAPKAPPLALTVLNQLKDSRREGKTMLFNPLQVAPAVLEFESVEQGIASLAALAFELLSGRPPPARAADYRPIAPLSEAGNLCLRRGLEQSSSFPLAGHFIDELATGGRCAFHKEELRTRDGSIR